MTRRPPNSSGRVTAAPSADAAEAGPRPFRKRQPVMFWFVMIAVLAMVLSIVALPLALLVS